MSDMHGRSCAAGGERLPDAARERMIGEIDAQISECVRMGEMDGAMHLAAMGAYMHYGRYMREVVADPIGAEMSTVPGDEVVVWTLLEVHHLAESASLEIVYRKSDDTWFTVYSEYGSPAVIDRYARGEPVDQDTDFLTA